MDAPLPDPDSITSKEDLLTFLHALRDAAPTDATLDSFLEAAAAWLADTSPNQLPEFGFHDPSAFRAVAELLFAGMIYD